MGSVNWLDLSAREIVDDHFAITKEWSRQVVDELMSKRPPMLFKLMLNFSKEEVDAEQRRVMLARLERAQAARGAKLVRAAGEAVPNAAAPGITPDTAWTGDYDVLIRLFEISQYRVSTEAAYLSQRHAHCAPLGFLRPVFRQVRNRGQLSRKA